MQNSRFVSPLIRGLISVLTVLCFMPAAQAQANLDVRNWLNRPQVKLVVVEFYATWCKPCMEAIPRWKKLHDKYRDKGLRLIVVNTRDPNAGCRALPWNPDRTICDFDGVIDQRFGVNGKLPSAFLWSWQGNLLAKGAHIDEVEAAIQRYLDDAPRVLVEAEAPGDAGASLRAMVQSELSRNGKFTVVSSEEDMARLKALRKSTHGMTKRDDQRCALGQEVSPNSILKVNRFQAGQSGERLSLSLQSIETGCVTQQVSVSWRSEKPDASVGEGVAALLDNLRRAPQLPSGAVSAPLTTAPSNPTPTLSGAATSAEVGRLLIEGTPKGARVEVTGGKDIKRVGQLPFQLSVPPGPYEITVSAKGYGIWKTTETVEVDRTRLVDVKLLKPGRLEIVGEPKGATVRITGPAGFSGTTGLPASLKDAPSGEYQIQVSRLGYLPYEDTATVSPNRTTRVEVALERAAGTMDRAKLARRSASGVPIIQQVDGSDGIVCPGKGRGAIGDSYLIQRPGAPRDADEVGFVKARTLEKGCSDTQGIIGVGDIKEGMIARPMDLAGVMLDISPHFKGRIVLGDEGEGHLFSLGLTLSAEYDFGPDVDTSDLYVFGRAHFDFTYSPFQTYGVETGLFKRWYGWRFFFELGVTLDLMMDFDVGDYTVTIGPLAGFGLQLTPRVALSIRASYDAGVGQAYRIDSETFESKGGSGFTTGLSAYISTLISF